MARPIMNMVIYTLVWLSWVPSSSLQSSTQHPGKRNGNWLIDIVFRTYSSPTMWTVSHWVWIAISTLPRKWQIAWVKFWDARPWQRWDALMSLARWQHISGKVHHHIPISSTTRGQSSMLSYGLLPWHAIFLQSQQLVLVSSECSTWHEIYATIVVAISKLLVFVGRWC